MLPWATRGYTYCTYTCICTVQGVMQEQCYSHKNSWRQVLHQNNTSQYCYAHWSSFCLSHAGFGLMEGDFLASPYVLSCSMDFVVLCWATDRNTAGFVLGFFYHGVLRVSHSYLLHFHIHILPVESLRTEHDAVWRRVGLRYFLSDQCEAGYKG